MKRYPVLEVCARIEGYGVQHKMLREYCREFEDWQGLLEQAEREGMAPLLRKHLLESDSDFPAPVRRSLNLLYRRHKKQAEVRLRVLGEVLKTFQQLHLTPMLIKGAALCRTIYPDPALRPMRDIDILFSRDEVDQAQGVLRGAGFEQSTAPIPPDHHHLPSMYLKADDVKVCIELHRGLYPNCPPYYPEVDFGILMKTGQKLSVGEIEVTTFNHEETLHYLYQHGLRAPLTYETFKLINAADIIGYMEKFNQEIDWDLVRERYPQLIKALPLLHYISPWNIDRIPEDFIEKVEQGRKWQVMPFRGWPQRRRKELKKDQVSLFESIKETFFPSRWWSQVYYGTGYSFFKFMKVLCFTHPKNVFWWVRLYLRIRN